MKSVYEPCNPSMGYAILSIFQATRVRIRSVWLACISMTFEPTDVD